MTKKIIILSLLFLSYGGFMAHSAIPHHHETEQEHSGGHNHHHHHDDHCHGSDENENTLAHFWSSIVHIPGSGDLILNHGSSDTLLKIISPHAVVAENTLLIGPLILSNHHPPDVGQGKTSSFSVTNTPLRAPPARP